MVVFSVVLVFLSHCYEAIYQLIRFFLVVALGQEIPIADYPPLSGPAKLEGILIVSSYRYDVLVSTFRLSFKLAYYEHSLIIILRIVYIVCPCATFYILSVLHYLTMPIRGVLKDKCHRDNEYYLDIKGIRGGAIVTLVDESGVPVEGGEIARISNRTGQMTLLQMSRDVGLDLDEEGHVKVFRSSEGSVKGNFVEGIKLT